MRYKNDVGTSICSHWRRLQGRDGASAQRGLRPPLRAEISTGRQLPEPEKALEEKDAPTAFRAAHTLKGVCQNLGFDALYVPSSALTEALRGGSLDGADELFPPVEKEYQRVVEGAEGIRINLSVCLRSTRPGCGTQHPQHFVCVLLAAAPTATPCFRHWRRSSLLPLPRGASGEEIRLYEMPRPPLVRGGGTPSGVTERLFLNYAKTPAVHQHCGCFRLDEYQELSVIISGLPAEPRSS